MVGRITFINIMYIDTHTDIDLDLDIDTKR
jgi:hypothetical protein